jgi:hypothetical protein
LRVAISYLSAHVLAVAPYWGWRAQRLSQLPMCGLNPQYGATEYAGVDMATRKNAISGCPS